MVGGIGRQTGRAYIAVLIYVLIKPLGVGLSVGGRGQGGYPLRLGHRVNYKTGLFLEKGDGRQCRYQSKGCLLLTNVTKCTHKHNSKSTTFTLSLALLTYFVAAYPLKCSPNGTISIVVSIDF